MVKRWPDAEVLHSVGEAGVAAGHGDLDLTESKNSKQHVVEPTTKSLKSILFTTNMWVTTAIIRKQY